MHRLRLVAVDKDFQRQVEGLGPTTTRYAWKAFASRLRQIFLSRDACGTYLLDWLTRAVGYALRVPDTCFDGVGDLLTVPGLLPGMRYADALAASQAAHLPVSLVPVLVCDAGAVFHALIETPTFCVAGDPFAWLEEHQAALVAFRAELSRERGGLAVPPPVLVKKFIVRYGKG